MSAPLVTQPVPVVDTPGLTISEYFGHVASKDGTASFAVVDVRAADDAAFQTPAFAEYVICNAGAIEARWLLSTPRPLDPSPAHSS